MNIKFNDIIKNQEYRERVIKYFRLPMRLSVSEDKFLNDIRFMKITNPAAIKQIIEFTEHDFNKEAREQGTSTPDFTMEHILESIVQDLEVSPGWQAFLKQDYSDVLADYEGITNTHGFYKKENDGKHFISIDLKSANWQSLQSIVGFDQTYEEFVIKYTDNLIPPISKAFRTKITGILGAKPIMNYNIKLLSDNQSAIVDSIYNATNIDFRGAVPFAFYADEFLIEIDNNMKDKLNLCNLEELEEVVYKDTGVKVHLRPFTLRWLGVKKGCVKLYKDKKYEIINISKDILLIINKILRKVVIDSVDFEKIKLNNQTEKEYINDIENAITKVLKEHIE